MDIKITQADLEAVKDTALNFYKDKHQYDIDAKLFPVLCHIKGIEALLIQRGININIIYEDREFNEPIDNY